MYELEGTIKIIFETQTFDSGFTKREFVVTTDEKYPQDIKFGCLKDKVSILDGLSAGDKVKASFDIRGREYNERYYVDLNAWKIESLSGGGSAQAPASDERPPLPSEELTPGDEDDLPF